MQPLYPSPLSLQLLNPPSPHTYPNAAFCSPLQYLYSFSTLHQTLRHLFSSLLQPPSFLCFSLQINLRLILVSGKTKEFLFSPSESAGDIAQFVFDNWPQGESTMTPVLPPLFLSFLLLTHFPSFSSPLFFLSPVLHFHFVLCLPPFTLCILHSFPLFFFFFFTLIPLCLRGGWGGVLCYSVPSLYL